MRCWGEDTLPNVTQQGEDWCLGQGKSTQFPLLSWIEWLGFATSAHICVASDGRLDTIYCVKGGSPYDPQVNFQGPEPGEPACSGDTLLKKI